MKYVELKDGNTVYFIQRDFFMKMVGGGMNLMATSDYVLTSERLVKSRGALYEIFSKGLTGDTNGNNQSSANTN